MAGRASPPFGGYGLRLAEFLGWGIQVTAEGSLFTGNAAVAAVNPLS